MKVRFTEDVQAETEGRHKGPVYKAGSEVDLPLSSAQRWLRRGVAVVVAVKSRPVRAERPMMTPKPEVKEPEPAKEPTPNEARAESGLPQLPPAEPKPEPEKPKPAAEPEKPKRGRPRRG